MANKKLENYLSMQDIGGSKETRQLSAAEISIGRSLQQLYGRDSQKSKVANSEMKIIDGALIQTLMNIDKGVKTNLLFEKYPGMIHLYFNSIEKFTSGPKNLISLTVKIGDKSYKSNKFPVKAFIKPDLYVSFLINERIRSDLQIDISISTHLPFDSFASSHDTIFSNLKINNTILNDLQNNFVEEKLYLKPKPTFLSKTMMKLFNSKPLDYPVCRCYCSYIAEADTKMFNTVPNSLLSLSRYVLFRRVAFKLMFEGSLNIKCELYSFTWQKKYVKWYGYTLFILDPHTKLIEQIIDISACEQSLEILLKRIIRFNISGNSVEMECLDAQSFNKCNDSLYTLFPKLFNFIE